MLTLFKYAGLYLKKFAKDEKGQGMVEYGLIIALIAAVVVLALTPLGEAVRALFDGLIDDVTP
ncbi:MAG: Flp/Fap pilin component [Petroclostridium sp.]|jgi:pilus assembly protein Flp/PilA|uniref:Flp family type IVb pilin n=1 Tax=Petroclostridium xylanilyticum TaxID=1792311 RepID=UPI000B98BE7D|nr:Flp family type IVb pilin [Petroclostridium xylanilyticum]MBZ4645088.1 Flp/Fap pilin component [Clostridia bacterium]MDK2811405.1 Flp/Fap pilin component [Petroclostridium sp.]